METEPLTLTELRRATGAASYVIIYLKENGRLPIARESKGRGYLTLYHPDAIEVIESHLAKSRGSDIRKHDSPMSA